MGLLLLWPLPLRSTGSRHTGSAAMAPDAQAQQPGPSCSMACGIFPDWGMNPCPLHRQADSQPLHHQGSPHSAFLISPKFTSPYTTVLSNGASLPTTRCTRSGLPTETLHFYPCRVQTMHKLHIIHHKEGSRRYRLVLLQI